MMTEPQNHSIDLKFSNQNRMRLQILIYLSSKHQPQNNFTIEHYSAITRRFKISHRNRKN